MTNPSSQGARDGAIEQLHAIRERLQAAENAGDAAYIGSVMADDAVIMVPNEPVQDGRAACAAFVHRMLAESRAHFNRYIEYVSAEVHVLGGFAFDRGTFAFTVQPKSGGEVSNATGKYLWLYSRSRDGGWKVSRMILSIDEEEQRC